LREKETELRNFVFDRFMEHVSAFEWNANALVPIVPAVQIFGSEQSEEVNTIALTGFEISPEKESGRFGQGLYFTTNTLLENSEKKETRILVLSLTIPGNVYPVIEQHKLIGSNLQESVSPVFEGKSTLLGNPIVAGYNSHYVLTTKDGGRSILSKEEATPSDELIVAQESQVLPVFVVYVTSP